MMSGAIEASEANPVKLRTDFARGAQGSTHTFLCMIIFNVDTRYWRCRESVRPMMYWSAQSR